MTADGEQARRTSPRQPGRDLMSWLRYALGGLALVLAAPLTPWNRTPNWPLNIVIGLGGLMLILGHRRIFRAAVSRPAPDEVVCHFAPWFEGYAYTQVLIPLMALAATVEGFTTGPRWFAYSGIVVLTLTSMFPVGLAVARRRSFLRLTPAELSVRAGGPVTVIPRADVDAIEPATGTQRIDSRQVGVVYRATDSAAGPITKTLPGLQLTVEPDNLLHALRAWNDPRPDDTPRQSMDRVEAILRGRPGTGPDHRHWGRP